MNDRPSERADGKLAVALISEVFWEPDGPIRAWRNGWPRLSIEVRTSPCCPRSRSIRGAPQRRTPGTTTPSRSEAPRSTAQAEAAAEARDRPHRRHHPSGRERPPDEPRADLRRFGGPWSEATRSSTSPRRRASGRRATTSRGDEPPRPIDAFGVPIGIQLCSDVNRPEGTHLLGRAGSCRRPSIRGPPRRRRTSGGRRYSSPMP